MEKIPPINTNEKREPKDVYLMGGTDLEMYQTKKRLSRSGEGLIDKNLRWGAKIEDYANEIQEILSEGNTPVAIELANAATVDGVIDIDHHGEKASRPSALAQVMERMGKPMSFIDQLVAANDSGYIPGMRQFFKEHRDELLKKYSPDRVDKLEEKLINLIRAKDRQMQGVKLEDEARAEEAIATAERTSEGLIITRIPSGKWSPIADRLFSSWPNGRQNLIAICFSENEEKHFYYFGRGDICKELKDYYKGWGGGTGYGNIEKDGFSGCITKDPDEVIKFIRERLIQNNGK